MQTLDPGLLERIDDYIEQLFAPPDDTLKANLRRAEAAGLPSINVSATEGKLLYIITKLVRATRVLEVGTLGGYSTTWLARALAPGGIVVTLEVDPTHAAVARQNLEGAAPETRIDVREGDALQSLAAMAAAQEPAFDLIFIDADKPRYVRYLEASLPLSRPGTVILADNLIRHGAVLSADTTDDSAAGARAYNTAIAAHPRLESIVLPIIRDKVDGLSISIVKEGSRGS
jgi:predicted O-methyltransferase YrrM